MASKNGSCKFNNREEKWMANYEALKAYIDEHYHQPVKHKVEY